MLVAQVEREPDAVAGLRRVGQAGTECVDFAFGQHLGEDAGRADQVLLGFGVEPRLGASLADTVAHGDGLPPHGGDLADESVQLFEVEGFAESFGMVDEGFDFSLHGSFLSVEFLDDGGKQGFGFGGLRTHVPAPVEVDDQLVSGLGYPEFTDASLPDSVLARFVEPHHLNFVGFAVDRCSAERPCVEGVFRSENVDFDVHFRLLMVSSYSVALLLIKRSSMLIANELSNIDARYIDKRNDSVDVQCCQVGFERFIGYSTFTYRMMHWSNSS